MADSSGEGQALATPTVNVSEFIVECTDQIDATVPGSCHDEFLTIVSTKMGITTEMASELDAVCQLTSLDCEGEPTGIYSGPSAGSENWKDIPSEVTALVSLNLQRDEQSQRRNDTNYRALLTRNLKYKALDAPWMHEIKHRLHREEQLPVPRDAIITIQVYNPSQHNKSLDALKVMMDIHVLGQQPLTSIRDQITCRLDNLIPGELSEQPDIPPDYTAKDQFPSGFFFIEGVFYNDMRHPNSRDYSLVIRDWVAQDPRRGLGPYESTAMEDTTLDMLSFQLGHPYIYMHQANCEHAIVFTDVRLVHPEDCLKVEEYPIVIVRYKSKPIKCRVCLKNAAMWNTHGSTLAPEDPCYFCDTCFRMLHYNQHGEKIGNFRAYYCKGVS